MRARGTDLLVQARPGELGQFDVVVDGEVVASRQRSGLARLLGGGWPSASDVLQSLDRRGAGTTG